MAKKKFELNRKVYQSVKKMDHNQMNNFMQNMYDSGFKDGQVSVPTLDIGLIKKSLLSVKGIGEKKATDVIAAIEKEIT